MKHMLIVAHPDDEVLGLGGYLYDRIRCGDEVSVIIANETDIPERPDLVSDMRRSHDVLGIRNVYGLDLMNLSISAYSPSFVVPMMEQYIKELAPDLIYTHSPTDINPDHQAVSAFAQQAARYYQRHMYQHRITGLYYMEVPSATNWGAEIFRPDTYLEISEAGLQKKIEALACYNNVLRQDTHPRSDRTIRALATVRGSVVGVRYAEAIRTAWRIGGAA